jgi:hypothetical protein
MGPKICIKCEQPKNTSEFSKKSGGRLHARCKQCRRDDYEENKAQHQLTYQNKRDKRLAEQRHQRKRRRLLVIQHYGGKCACCGEINLEFLTVDHINGDGSKHRRELGTKRKTDGRYCFGGSTLYLWLIKNKFPEGFRILCWNCNSSLGLYGYCPHTRTISTLETDV